MHWTENVATPAGVLYWQCRLTPIGLLNWQCSYSYRCDVMYGQCSYSCRCALNGQCSYSCMCTVLQVCCTDSDSVQRLTWKGDVSQKRGSQPLPQWQRTIASEGLLNGPPHLMVRQLLRLHLGAYHLNGADGGGCPNCPNQNIWSKSATGTGCPNQNAWSKSATVTENLSLVGCNCNTSHS